MNPDDLIMKYIDGELSYSEDEELRNMISLEPKIKEDFDLDIYIHSAIKEDSRAITPSPEVVSSTEDKVLMKILASQKVAQPIIKFRKRTYAYVAAVAVFILVNFIYFGDNIINNDLRLSQLKEQMNLFSPQTILDESENIDLKTDNQFKNTLISENKTKKADKKQAQIEPINNLSQSDLRREAGNNQNLNVLSNIEDNYHTTILNDIETKQKQNISQIDLAQAFDFPKEEVIIDNAVTKPMLNLNGAHLNLFQPSSDFYTQSSDIQFSSFFGTDVLRNGIPDKKIGITHISQAISYSINNTQRIGIEMGYTEYSYEQTVNVLVPLGSINDERFIVPQFNNDNENDLILYPIKFNKNQQVFWGAAFYEESLLSNEYLSLVGRIGGGTTSDGPLGYTRFFAKINVLKNVSVSLGTEGRLFLGRVPELNSEKSWKSSVSLIYGFQFKF
ncbi:MAG: hypothetical protein N2319_04160 [Candidatus Kapabacteria bacterium]|nr:hypothetical protein [Candidatus Kapabacteria bacterium]